jgi:LysM repeat protein
MRALREMGGGLVIAIASVLLVIGGISLSLAENSPSEQPTPTPLPPIFSTSIDVPIITLVAVDTVTSEPTFAPTSTFESSPTQPAPILCNPPAGWLQIIIGANDTLYTIAERYKTSPEILNTSNCLNNTLPAAGSTLYVPPVPTVTVIPCGPYPGWVRAYTVQPGDNLYRISLLYRTSVAQLQTANCMGASITIYAGQRLYVPNVPTSTPGITITPTFNTSTPSLTPIPTETFIVTESPVPVPTDTFMPTASYTPITPSP